MSVVRHRDMKISLPAPARGIIMGGEASGLGSKLEGKRRAIGLSAVPPARKAAGPPATTGQIAGREDR